MEYKTILTSPAALKKDPIYNFAGLVANGIFVRNGRRWEELRKPLNKLMTKKIVESNLNMFHEKSIILCQVLKKYADSGESFNLRHYVTNFTLDAICVSNFGYDLNELENERHHVLERMERIVEMVLELGSNFINMIFFQLVSISANGRAVVKSSRAYWKLTYQMLQARLQDKQKMGEDIDDKPIFYSDVILQKAKHYNLTWEETGKLATDFLIAGFDTSAVTMSYVLLLLAMYPEHQEAVYQEQLDILGEDPEVVPTWEQLSKMSYLTRVIKEVLRLSNPPGIFRKLTNDLDLGEGYKLPKGCTAFILFYYLHRNPTLWAHPNEFYPDHFLPEECAKRPKNTYFPFSWGPRSCPGSIYAMAGSKVLVSTVIRKYKLETDLQFDELEFRYSLLIEIIQGYMVRIKPRI
ncbi:cytochrome P450 4c3-like isoform X2 [Rhodnius prolixus]|uniref:cytochrome P450 4c3-like isoform X2 n=1 Tax=Rhodnius prolixus TaxID=13249 RepID=UPI003D18A6A5